MIPCFYTQTATRPKCARGLLEIRPQSREATIYTRDGKQAIVRLQAVTLSTEGSVLTVCGYRSFDSGGILCTLQGWDVVFHASAARRIERKRR